jgi:hypothetical protein
MKYLILGLWSISVLAGFNRCGFDDSLEKNSICLHNGSSFNRYTCSNLDYVISVSTDGEDYTQEDFNRNKDLSCYPKNVFKEKYKVDLEDSNAESEDETTEGEYDE